MTDRRLTISSIRASVISRSPVGNYTPCLQTLRGFPARSWRVFFGPLQAVVRRPPFVSKGLRCFELALAVESQTQSQPSLDPATGSESLQHG